MEIRRLGAESVSLVADIDRSEHIDVEYQMDHGSMVERPVSMPDVPPWDPVGDGPHSVAAQMAFCRRVIDEGGTLLAAFENGEVAGLAVVVGEYEAELAWLAFLHVSRRQRRRGVAATLWSESVAVAVESGAEAMYVSAVPTGSAVGFYLSRGCRLADPVHAALFAAEPDDIHLVCRF